MGSDIFAHSFELGAIRHFLINEKLGSVSLSLLFYAPYDLLPWVLSRVRVVDHDGVGKASARIAFGLTDSRQHPATGDDKSRST